MVARDVVVQKWNEKRRLVAWVVDGTPGIVILSTARPESGEERSIQTSDESIIATHGLNDLAHVVWRR